MQISAKNSLHNTEAKTSTKKLQGRDYVTAKQINNLLDKLCPKECSCSSSKIELDELLIVDANMAFYSGNKEQKFFLDSYKG